MALMWWPVAVLGVLCLLGTVALAVLIPTRRSPGDGLALANTARLSRLPEYRAVLAARTRSTAMVLAVLVVLFGATVVASARPSTTTQALPIHNDCPNPQAIMYSVDNAENTSPRV